MARASTGGTAYRRLTGRAFCLVTAIFLILIPYATASKQYHATALTSIKQGGGRVDWSPSGDLIAFDKFGTDGYTDVYTMRPDGSGEVCLTCDHPNLPNKHMGNPAWHPSEEYIVFQAEKATHPGTSDWAEPGLGQYNDLWVLELATSEATRIRELPNLPDYGTLHPHFSHDGLLLSWSEMYEGADFNVIGREFGYWRLRIGDFVATPTPRLENIREWEPAGSPAFYENHGFTPGDRALIFSRGPLTSDTVHGWSKMDIVRADLVTGLAMPLTDTGYNEHGIVSPDGSKIVWMTSNDVRSGTDLWLMDADGSNKERLTCMTTRGHPHFVARNAIAADSTWSPDQDQIAVKVQAGGIEDVQIIVVDIAEGPGDGCRVSSSGGGLLLLFLVAIVVLVVLAVALATRRRSQHPR